MPPPSLAGAGALTSFAMNTLVIVYRGNRRDQKHHGRQTRAFTAHYTKVRSPNRATIRTTSVCPHSAPKRAYCSPQLNRIWAVARSVSANRFRPTMFGNPCFYVSTSSACDGDFCSIFTNNHWLCANEFNILDEVF